MLDPRTVAFRMPSCLPAISVVFLRDGTFAAVDGITCEISVFSATGTFLQSYCVSRAYRAIRRSTVSPTEDILFALGNCNIGTPNRVYLLNSRFDEVGSFDLSTPENTCCAEVGELTDIYPCGEELYAAFRHGIFTYDLDGYLAETILPIDLTRVLLHYTVSGTARALAFCKNETFFVNIAEIGAVYLGTIPDQFVLRDLVPHMLGDVWGLLGYRYWYNYLMPVYQNGSFCLPRETFC